MAPQDCSTEYSKDVVIHARPMMSLDRVQTHLSCHTLLEQNWSWRLSFWFRSSKGRGGGGRRFMASQCKLLSQPSERTDCMCFQVPINLHLIHQAVSASAPRLALLLGSLAHTHSLLGLSSFGSQVWPSSETTCMLW